MNAKGDLTAAELLLREALEVRRETLGNRHPHTLISIGNLRVLLIYRRLESTYKYIASSCRSPCLVTMTTCAAVFFAILLCLF